MKILAIEDNEILNVLYASMFKKLEIPFCLAKNGQEALRFYKKVHFDLILCDFYLPDTNGFDLCKQLRVLEEEKGEKQIPILIISGDKEVLKKEPAEFDGWIEKPLTEEKLKNILKRYSTEY